MKDRRRGEGVDPIVEAATGWFVRLHEDPADPTARPAFEAWRDADPRHARAYERLQRLWGASAHLPSLARASAGPDRRTVLRVAAGAGGGAVVAALVGRLTLGPHPFADYGTHPGERARVTVADGSQVELSTATALDIDFSARRRRVKLLDGEAWFEVAGRDPRPFVVEAASGAVTALEGAFAVAVDGPGASVSVTDRAARVSLRGAATPLPEGFRLSYDRRGLGAARAADPDLLAWREGRLVLINQPLSKVAATLDRWTGGRTVILDTALAARRVTLITETADADRALEQLAQAAPMRLWRRGPLLTVVTTI